MIRRISARHWEATLHQPPHKHACLTACRRPSHFLRIVYFIKKHHSASKTNTRHIHKMSRFSKSIVTSAWLREQLGANKKVRVFDCTTVLDTAAERKPYEVVSGRAGYEKSHIPGAEFFEIQDFSKGPEEVAHDKYGNPLSFMMLEPKEFLSRLGAKKGIDNDSHIVLYHHSKPLWATRVWWMLYASGFAGEYSVLDGGLAKWVAEGGETAEGPDNTVHEAKTLEPSAELLPSYKAFVGKEEVQAALSKGGNNPVIHALPKPSYDGANGMYGKAGHITGAVNVSFLSLLNAEDHDTFAPVETVQKTFAAAGITEKPESLTTYCGAGISATVPVFLALTQLGWDCPIHMYDGSLAEWCGDESCPMTNPKL